MRDRYAAMIPLDEYRFLLGSFASKLTEEQILTLRRQEFEIANAIFELWLKTKGSGKPLADSS
jgi:hypothetical protein